MDVLIVTGGISLDVLLVALVAGRCVSTSGISRRRAVLAGLASSVVFLLLLSLMVVGLMVVHYLSR
jgi:hypothetical protein